MKKHLTIVIKLGTSSIVDEKTHQPLLTTLSTIAETAKALRDDGHRVVLCSSGAIGLALRQMDLPRRPKHLPQVQALAAIGQCKLMAMWDQLFHHLRQPVAQILLSRNDIADRTQYLNAQNTFAELLNMGVIPVVNENDSLSVQEIKFGDNDTLSAITAGMVSADYLFLMTDVDCLYDKNPRTHLDAKPIEVVENISDLEADVSSRGSSLGTGGMSTKITAARLATAAGVTTVITRSSKPGNIRSIVRYAEREKAAARSMESSQELSAPSTPPRPPVRPPQRSSTVILSATASVFTPQSSTPDSPTPPPSLNGAVAGVAIDIEESAAPPLHTRFLPSSHPIRDRHFWILHGLAPHGTIYIDNGAFNALNKKAGLFPVGVVDVVGDFAQHECARVFKLPSRDAPLNEAEEVGRALVNYSAAEIRRIKGFKSDRIAEIIGYADSDYVALRENVALFTVVDSVPSTPVPSTPTAEHRALHMGRLMSYVDG